MYSVIKDMSSILYILFPLLFVASVSAVEHTVYWNTSNDLFRTGDPLLTVRMGDRLRVFCPDEKADDDEKYLHIYQVSYMSFTSCMLETNRRRVVNCDSSMVGRSFIINVLPTSPVPNALEYRPGQDYYWISTSSGDKSRISQDRGGLCQTDNLRLQLAVSETAPVRTTTTPTTPAAPATPPARATHVLRSHVPVVPRRHLDPSQISSANLPADIDKAHFIQVADRAINGWTGTYPRDKSEEVAQPSSSFEPFPVELYSDVFNGAQNTLYESIHSPNEPIDFVIDENPANYARSYPYSSSSSLSQLIFSLLLLCCWMLF